MSEHQTEIVIIKRKGGHEDGHHGGAWKIAFADFMTAMMAFFLVLWIINATDKDTKTIIARYFNPVKLENPARARKGVHGMDASKVVSDENSGEQAEGAETGPPNNQGREQKGPAAAAPTPAGAPPKKDENPTTPGAETNPAPSNAVDVKPTMSETALFSDPYRSLGKIAGRPRSHEFGGLARHRRRRAGARSRRDEHRGISRSFQAGRTRRSCRLGIDGIRRAASPCRNPEAGSRTAEKGDG